MRLCGGELKRGNHGKSVRSSRLGRAADSTYNKREKQDIIIEMRARIHNARFQHKVIVRVVD